MAISTSKLTLGCDPRALSPRTCGPLGHNDAASPFSDLIGDTPGSLGVNDHAAPDVPLVLSNSGVVQWVLERGKDLTKECEGNKGKPYWPQGASGITIGYGYDMKERSTTEIKGDLMNSGVASDLAVILSSGANKSKISSPTAEEFLESEVIYHGVKKPYGELEIDQSARDGLFDIVYKAYNDDVARICDKDDVVNQYGETDWPSLHPAIKAILIDLRFRGDYTPALRLYVQKSVSKNDPPSFSANLKAYLAANKNEYEAGIVSRFDKRIAFVQQYGCVVIT